MVAPVLFSGIFGLLILVTFTGVQCGSWLSKQDNSEYVLVITSDTSTKINDRFAKLGMGGYYLAHAYKFKYRRDTAMKYHGILFKFPKGEIGTLAKVVKKPHGQSNFQNPGTLEAYFIYKNLSRLPSYFEPNVQEVIDRANQRWERVNTSNKPKDISFDLLYSDTPTARFPGPIVLDQSGRELFSQYADKKYSVPKIPSSKGQKTPRTK
ncbi:uncharacterized protein LOC129592578 [Paramacrobiotus metropolitanus]|uniref:uncharacterized protein LOC129592578 n=1 Tax=Paramacrobiotus metropolitanus TaxID=2943436 RepID=UPI002445EF20|nr:uncharacterized protein LOC129592578 [Paramacrobiotus metropolitanus]